MIAQQLGSMPLMSTSIFEQAFITGQATKANVVVLALKKASIFVPAKAASFARCTEEKRMQLHHKTLSRKPRARKLMRLPLRILHLKPVSQLRFR